MRTLLFIGLIFFQFSAQADLMPSGSLNCKRTDRNPLKCLACSIYFEARGESLQSQVDVAQTMITRVLDDYFPDTMCEVVWQGSQFSWTHDGKSDYIPNGPVLWRVLDAVNIAVNAGPNGLDHYYAQKIVHPRWARVSRECRNTKQRRGDHTFCNIYYNKDMWRSGLFARDILRSLEPEDIPVPTPAPRIPEEIPIPTPAPRDALEKEDVAEKLTIEGIISEQEELKEEPASEELTVEEIILEQEAEEGLPEGLKEYPNEEYEEVH